MIEEKSKEIKIKIVIIEIFSRDLFKHFFSAQSPSEISKNNECLKATSLLNLPSYSGK